ncbi:MAG TPA: KpsF/GutQ family sugar-phosphate isomerase [Phycisphaerae bacterium]|nr:KpsF/GutQ family sugar-phosphate isomerase [Phycisphaerae bacterium]
MSDTTSKAQQQPAADGSGAQTGDDADSVLAKGLAVLQKEARAIQEAADRLSGTFVDAVHLLMRCRGRVAVTGMGKAGLIGDKIQATLSSTGTAAYFLHPVEALHGDLGMIRADDVVISLSRSGETQELIQLLPSLKKVGCTVILVTARPRSRCARLADLVLDIGDVPEACPLGLAPSSSTAAMLAVGDALALTVMELKDVQPDQYAAFHPGGALGRSLMKAGEIMRTGPDCPIVQLDGTLQDYYEAIEAAPQRAGAAVIVDADGRLQGIFTHGDLARLRPTGEPHRIRIADIMTSPCKSARVTDRVADALQVMRTPRIDELPVIDDADRAVGMIDIQDLIASGFSAFDDQ